MAYNMFSASPFDNYSDIYGSSHNRVTQSSKYTMANIFKAYATYNFKLKDKHEFKVMAGMDAETRERLSHYSERRGLISTILPEIALATGDQYSYNSSDSYHNDFAAAGFFGRINYNYLQKYLLEINARYDGSSKFPKGEKWALFPQDGNNSEEYKKLYNEALVKKTTEMVDIYGEIIDKAVKLLRKSTTSKDLVNIANVIKIAEQRQFVLLMIREDKDSG